MSKTDQFVPAQRMYEFSEESVTAKDSSAIDGNGSSDCSKRREDLTLDYPAIISPENLLVDHDAISRSETLFYQKLREFSADSAVDGSSLDAKDKGLDLYSMYREVIARGGFDRVGEEQRWDEIASALHLKPTISNLSIVQQHYRNLLYQFEQVFFFQKRVNPSIPGLASGLSRKKAPTQRTKNPLSLPSKRKRQTDPKTASASGTRSQADRLATNGLSRKESSTGRAKNSSSSLKRKARTRSDPNTVSSADKGRCHVGKMVTGTVDTEFDGGFTVTDTVGSEKLSGVLFRAPVGETKRHCTTVVPGLVDKADSPDKTGPADEQKRSKRNQNSGAQRKPGNRPGIRNSFLCFWVTQKELFRQKHKGEPYKEILKIAADAWRCLSENEKKPYREMSLRDKERLSQEMRASPELRKGDGVDEEKHDETQSGLTVIGPADRQAENHQPRRVFGEDDCYHVKLDMELESSDSASAAAANGANEFLNDLVLSWKSMGDAELLDYIGSSWGAMGDSLCELPLVGDAPTA